MSFGIMGYHWACPRLTWLEMQWARSPAEKLGGGEFVNDIKGLELPLDCRATYYPDFMAPGERDALFRRLRENYDLSDRTMKMADGSDYALDTGAMMFVDRPLIGEFSEDIWGKIVEWPALLKRLKDRIEPVAQREYRVCRCIHYKDGGSGCDFHADYPAYGDLSSIASISLGEEREFLLRKIEDHSDLYRLTLGDGSLLIMGEGCQERYEHALPANDKYKSPRINLTFRPFGWD